ncbi:hypothetical protein EC973_007097 [Apophysomyces ossiformis]|uniref:Pre-mRNA-splicing factor 38 n=1 Tax=Apophysomyces ossiformis TaxID=679940 RepID=A0A8H7BZ19_9FUNG|nr:hypothetical protein EC973_007097 [Apophysomyces ossiformis]
MKAPFLRGTNPSTAFCCLYKLWTLRLTVRQVENLIDHTDSPYIRAIGFIYLRYVCAPAQLWDWFSYYLDDPEEIDLTGGPKPQKSTIGKLVRMLITEQKYQGTMLPRIPVPIARDLAQKLEDYDRQKKLIEDDVTATSGRIIGHRDVIETDPAVEVQEDVTDIMIAAYPGKGAGDMTVQLMITDEVEDGVPVLDMGGAVRVRDHGTVKVDVEKDMVADSKICFTSQR